MLLRDLSNVSYIVTVLADSEGRTQLSPAEQIIPNDWVDRFVAADKELGYLTDDGMEMLALNEESSDDLTMLELKAPTAVEILGAVETPGTDLEFMLFELAKESV